MSPNSALIRDYSTFGDLSQRDLYHRHKNQIIKEGAVENFFYHLDAANAAVNTVLEKVTFDTSSNVSTYELYTKPTTGNLDLSANASMLEITTAKTSVRSVRFEANDASFGDLAASGNAAVTGTLEVTGNTSLSNVSASGDAAITGTLDVTGNTSLSNVSASGDAGITGTLDVTGDTSLSNVSASGDATITGTLEVTGNTSLSNVSVSGDADITGTLEVTGNTSMSNVSVSGDAGITGTLDVTGNTSMTNVSASGDATITGTLEVTGNTSLSNVSASGDAAITGTLDVTGDTSLGNVAIVGTLDVTGNTTIALGEDGVFSVTGNGNVDIGSNDLHSSGNVYFEGLTTIQNLALTGTSGFAGDLDMGNNNILNVATLTRDNVRVALDNTARSILAQTWDAGAQSWSTTTTTSQDTFQVNKSLAVTSASTLGGSLTVNGPTLLNNTVGVGGVLNMNSFAITNAANINMGNIRTTLSTSENNGNFSVATWNGSAWNPSFSVTGGQVVAQRALVAQSWSSVAGNLIVGGNISVAGPSTTFGTPTSNTALTLYGTSNLLGPLTVQDSLTVGGAVSFAGDLNMGNSNVINVATLTRDNVRINMDNVSRQLLMQTHTGSAWQTSLQITQNGVSTTKHVFASSHLSVGGNLMVSGNSTFGSIAAPTKVTLFGDLDIMGTTTNTRIESNVVQIGDKNIELGFLEVNDLGNLDGAGITIGGEGGTINTRPEFVYRCSARHSRNTALPPWPRLLPW